MPVDLNVKEGTSAGHEPTIRVLLVSWWGGDPESNLLMLRGVYAAATCVPDDTRVVIGESTEAKLACVNKKR